jgi:hypothetical protein
MCDHLDMSQMQEYLQDKLQFTAEESELIAKALEIRWRILIFMADAEITRRLENLDKQFTVRILHFLHTTYNNRGHDGKHKVPCNFVKQDNGSYMYG